MKLTNGLLAFLLFFFCYPALAQNNNDQALWQNIESAIEARSNLTITYARLTALKEKALKTNDQLSLARCYYNQMLIDDRRKEDSFFFRNSAFMDSILVAPQAPAMLRQCMHLLLAKRLGQYTRNRAVFGKRDYYAETPWLNYTLFANTKLDSIKVFHYDEANSMHALDGINQEQLNWLVSNLPLFLYAPDIHDLIYAQKAEMMDRPVTLEQDSKIRLPTWLSMPAPVWQRLIDSLAATGKIEHGLFRLYQQWLLKHRNNPTAAYFVAANFKNRLYKPYEDYYEVEIQSTYEARLLSDLQSSVPDIKVYAVYQLCRLWKLSAAEYFPYDNFDTAFCRQAAQLMSLAQANKPLIDSFPAIATAINILKEQLLVKKLEIAVDATILPGKPILVKISYRNRDQLWYRIVRTGGNLVRTGVLTLPAATDYNNHAVYDTLSPLAIGHYQLQFADHEIKPGDTGITPLSFSVTRIAFINDDEKLFILNREIGQPLAGAEVTGFVSHKNKRSLKKDINRILKLTADQQGIVSINDLRIDSLQVIFEGDTLYDYFSRKDPNVPDEIYSKKEYDDAIEYFDDKAELHFFTDRAIYRPGQTVHYKAIVLTRDLRTGQPITLNKQNLNTGLLSNHYKKWLKDIEPLWTYLKNPFYQTCDSTKISLNSYGSFSGSFTIPSNAPTGSWSMRAGYIEQANSNNGRFTVEEYKRPTFEMRLKTPERTILPAQPFTLTLKTHAFNGAILTGAVVHYTLLRCGKLPVYDSKTGAMVNRYEEISLQDTTVLANDKGAISILVNDSLLATYTLTDDRTWEYTYELKATAINAGESVTLNGNFSITSRPVKIRLSIPTVANRKELEPANITTTTKFEGTVGKNIRISIYKCLPGEKYIGFEAVDQWKYPAVQLENWFPEIHFRKDGKMKEELVDQVMVNTANENSFRLPVIKMSPGQYRVVGEYYEEGKLRGQTVASLTLFDTTDQTWPVADRNFSYLTANTVSPGQKVKYYYGNTKGPIHSVYQLKYQVNNKPYVKTIYYEGNSVKGMNQWEFMIPEEAGGNLLFTHLYILDNKLYQQTERVYINTPFHEQPRVVIESYRKQLVPGEKETFTIAFKTKDHTTAAELMTTLYDASLDKLKQHTWYLPEMRTVKQPVDECWNPTINSQATAAITYPVIKWQVVNPLLRLQGRVPGLVITQASGLLDQVQVVAYGTSQRFSTGNVSTVKAEGLNSLEPYRRNLVIIDGIPYTGNLDSLKSTSFSQAIIMEGADAVAIYGSRAADGVLIISTKGPVKLPANVPEQPIVVRNNFQETAFFFPAVHADRDGYFRFTFTMPQSVTEWNWKLLAHTKKAIFSYAERKLVTQLPLMVQPNIPVLLYQGDRIEVKSRIANLDTVVAEGKTFCRIEDAVTGQDITAGLVSKPQQPFAIAGLSNSITSFLINVPKDQQNPLKIMISARSQNFSDAEEHIIPVMTDNILVKESIPFRLLQNKDTTVRLPAINGLYGVGIAITPDPRAGLINALPYLANYAYNCAEQTFNKMLAHITANELMRGDKELQRNVDAARTGNTAKDTALNPADEEAAQAMPWLSLNNKTIQQHRELLQLLDTSRSNLAIENYLDQLLKLQNKDGGITWFSGGNSNGYISSYILAGFGRLVQNGWQCPGPQLRKYNNFINELVLYCDAQFPEHKELYYCYARHYWLEKLPLADSLQTLSRNFLREQAKYLDRSRLAFQAMWIMATTAYYNAGEDTYHRATALLDDIRQQAATDTENGMRWKQIADEDDLSMASEESIAILTEAFEGSAWSPSINAAVVRWLLNNKTDHYWSNTKATAAVVGLLKNAEADLVAAPQSLHTMVNNKQITVSNSLLDGRLYAFAQTDKAPASLTISKSDTGKVTGHIVYAYFKPVSQLAALNKEVMLEKKLYRYKTKEAVWEPVTESTVLQLADKVKVVLTIETGKTLRYIHIDDRKAGALEPLHYNSGYEYNGGLSTYKSIKTTGYQFFIDLVPAGKWEIAYEVKVTQEGQFTNGPAILQAMYNPQITAYSCSMMIKTSK